MLNSFFLGPHAENAAFFQQIWSELLQRTLQHRRNTFSADEKMTISPPDAQQYQIVESEIESFFAILQQEVPTFSTRYLGHMISDVSIPALIGHVAVLFCNPNLASREVASARMKFELQAINALAQMIDFEPKAARGHFTSGGTMANFEAFWRARYRLDHWLSMAAFLLETGHSNEDIFTLAHQGWEAFDENLQRHVSDMSQLAARSYVIQGPWDIANYYRDTLQRPFPQPVMLVPGNKHYSWPKSANVFGLSEKAIWLTELDRHGRVDLNSLRNNIEKAKRLQRPILMNVSVAGTTELGTVDPVDEVCELLEEYRRNEGIHIWHHIDAAYGGYFASTFKDGSSALPAQAIRAFRALPRADSVTLDPHKLGFVPYACGAFLVKDARSYAVSHISAPYLQEDPQVDHPSWSTTLEGSRSATGAGAVWLSSKVLPLNAGGHGAILNQTLVIKERFTQKLHAQVANIHFTPGSDTNIVSFVLARPGDSLHTVNQVSAAIFAAFVSSPYFAITRTALQTSCYSKLIDTMLARWNGAADDDHLLVLRMVIMSPYVDDTDAVDRLLQEFIAELNGYYAVAAGADIPPD